MPLELVEHTVWWLIIGIGLAGYHLLFPRWVAWVFTLEGVVAGGLIYGLHLAFDDPTCWLGRYAWFGHARDLHRVHHRVSSTAHFSCSKNYAIGGFGLQGHLIDRLMGTFQPLPTQRPYLRQPEAGEP